MKNTKKLEIKIYDFRNLAKTSKSIGFCQTLTVDDGHLAKSPRNRPFDHSFSGFLDLQSRMLNSTRETARDWGGRVGFWAGFAAFVKLPFRAKFRGLDDWQFLKGRGKGEGG